MIAPRTMARIKEALRLYEIDDGNAAQAGAWLAEALDDALERDPTEQEELQYQAAADFTGRQSLVERSPMAPSVHFQSDCPRGTCYLVGGIGMIANALDFPVAPSAGGCSTLHEP